MTDDSFGTVSGPFIHIEDPHPAVEQLLGPLFSKVLVFAGPGAHISSLRNYQCFRDKMARLSADALRTIELPAVPPPTDIDMMALREILTEPIYGPFGMQDGWKLNTLGLKALIASPLTSHRALANMIHPRAPGFVLVAMSKRPSTHSDLLDILVDAVLRGNHDQDVVFNLARHPNASANALTTARSLLANATPSSSLSSDAITYFEVHLARNKNTSKRDLTMLSRNRNPLVREAVGLNLNTDVADLVTLSSDADVNVRRAVASNPNLPRETMIAMSMDDDAYVRAAVASNTSIDKEFASLLVSLCNDNDMRVLRFLAQNPNVSVDDCLDLEQPLHRAILADSSEAPHTLRTLAEMEDDNLLVCVAENRSTPAGVLTSLAGSANDAVRMIVARNSSTPPSVLEQLASDTRAHVRLNVARNEFAPAAALVLETLASDDACKEFAAFNINTPPHVLDLLSKDEDDGIRSSVARNKSTPAHILEAMLEANEDHEEIMTFLLCNPNLSLNCLANAIVYELGREDESERMALYDFLMMSRDGQSRLCKLPVNTLVAMSQSSNIYVRREMAKNPLLPAGCLVTMSRDSDNDVVDHLASNPTVQMAVDELSCLLVRSGVARN